MIEQQQQYTPMVWVDLEMTGLDLNKEQIIEIAVIVTDSELNIIAQMDDSIIIHCDESVLSNMDEWNTQHHTQSGLVERVRKSTISLADAEQTVIQFLREKAGIIISADSNQDFSKKPLLAGNSVYIDRTFIAKQMPALNEIFHYRIIDVSGIKELCRRWYPEQYNVQPQKKKAHRALDDIIESIEELKYYRRAIFK